MKRLTDYFLKSKLQISWDNWNFTGIFGILMTITFITKSINLVGELIKFLFNL
ncbi:hypothetical protein UFOVP972_83 [uncultured Caudovirales phage]|uniref:Uncharacterized protein n=1 Tax=uncultured Caudovirales phage TaxID=2100421 RepID=A0A6J5Q082_9CAUD|nr:hypothetical protein UFOVP972_83 [uncultured Caudovirales phage]